MTTARSSLRSHPSFPLCFLPSLSQPSASDNPSNHAKHSVRPSDRPERSLSPSGLDCDLPPSQKTSSSTPPPSLRPSLPLALHPVAVTNAHLSQDEPTPRLVRRPPRPAIPTNIAPHPTASSPPLSRRPTLAWSPTSLRQAAPSVLLALSDSFEDSPSACQGRSPTTTAAKGAEEELEEA